MADSARVPNRRRRRFVWWSVAGVLALLVVCGVWVAVRAMQARAELEASLPLADKVQSQIASGDATAAAATTRRLARHLRNARDETGDPIWRAAEIIPVVGGNLSAVRQVAWAASDATDRSIAPLARLAGTLDLARLAPRDGTVSLRPLAAAAPVVTRANAALQSDLKSVRAIRTSDTIGPVANGVRRLADALAKAAAATDVASRAARLLPAMLGGGGPRDYLLVFQNNAEARSTGGIVGALALLHTDDGRITLVRQASTGDLPALDGPALPLSAATTTLYGEITGEFVQDTTLTPHFATSAALVRAMWERRYGTKVDGVISVDPVALGYILRATGPVDVGGGAQLTADNAVQVLLSESYARFGDPRQQDEFFAAAAAAVFTRVASGAFDPAAMLSALARAGDERRVLLWSAHRDEQEILAATTLSGPLPASTSTEHRFGVYLNDATGAKMDYYLHAGVGLGSARCRKDGRASYLVRVTLTSDAPADAATSLPGYVTGAGLSGVPAGDIHTRIAVYAPKGFVTVGARSGGRSVEIQRARDAGHGVAQTLVALAPGQSATYDFQFVGVAVAGRSPVSSTLAAWTTPGVWATDVRRIAFGCSSILR